MPPLSPGTDEPGTRHANVLARGVTYGLCGALLVAGIAQVELWPISAFRLFSSVRGAETVSWVVVTVDAQGIEHRVDLGGMPDQVGLPHHMLPRLVDATPAERTEVIETYLEAAGADASAASARVYRVVSRASTEAHVPSTELSRDLAYEVVLP